MLGFFDVLDGMGGMPDDAREHLRTMRHEAERVNRIIRDLLDYARANPEPVDEIPLGEVIDGTVGLLAPQKPFRTIEIQVTVPSDLPPVRANRDRLRQVLVNLLFNAADAIGEGGGTVSVDELGAQASEGVPPDAGFGDLITCASWADLWLNEGFATYAEALWEEHLYGMAPDGEDPLRVTTSLEFIVTVVLVATS